MDTLSELQSQFNNQKQTGSVKGITKEKLQFIKDAMNRKPIDVYEQIRAEGEEYKKEQEEKRKLRKLNKDKFY